MRTECPTLSELRSSLKSASRVQSVLDCLFDQLSDAASQLTEMGQSEMGVQTGLEVVNTAKEFLVEQMDALHVMVAETHKQITTTMKAGE